MTRIRWVTLVVLCGGVAVSDLCRAAEGQFRWYAPPEARERRNPVAADGSSIRRGKVVYDDNCQMCHGDAGKGDGPMADTLTTPPGDLSAEKMRTLSDGELFWRISTGDGVMPSFETEKPLTEQQRWDVINYIRTLANPSRENS